MKSKAEEILERAYNLQLETQGLDEEMKRLTSKIMELRREWHVCQGNKIKNTKLMKDLLLSYKKK